MTSRILAVRAWARADPLHVLALAGLPAAALYLLIWAFPMVTARLALLAAIASALCWLVVCALLLARRWGR